MCSNTTDADPAPAGTSSTFENATTPGASPPRGRSQGHAVLGSPAPRVDGQPLGAVRARSRPVVDQEHLAIDGQRNASHAAVVTSGCCAAKAGLTRRVCL